MMRNALYFILKSLFVLKIFKFLLRLFVHVETTAWLKDKIYFKIHDAPSWFTTITIHILPNISQSKGNETMKLGQSIEYNNRNIFLQKLSRKWSI